MQYYICPVIQLGFWFNDYHIMDWAFLMQENISTFHMLFLGELNLFLVNHITWGGESLPLPLPEIMKSQYSTW